MPQQTKSSFSTTARLSKAKQVTRASAEKSGFKCEINECSKVPFRNQTDLSRHKWVHLPVHLRPTCPFEGPHGYRCTETYTGRAEHIKIHWLKEHSEAGPYPTGTKWPKLNEILSKNHIKLGQNNPRVFSPRTSHSPSPAPSVEPVTDAPSPVGDYSNVPWSPDHQHSPPVHGYSFPLHVVPQGFFQPPVHPLFPHLNFPAALPYYYQSAALPHYHQYTAAPTYPTFVNGAYPAVSGQCLSNPFEIQVEDMGFDVSLSDLLASVTDEKWDKFVNQVC